MTDHQGYVKLIDFGISTNIQTEKFFEICGTVNYISPEM